MLHHVKPASSKLSAGLLMFRHRNHDRGLDVLLVHPGGPFFRNKDAGAWTIPKGEAAMGEDLLTRAQIEFEEEIGVAPGPTDGWIPLGSIKQRGGKTVHAWAFEGDCQGTSSSSQTSSRWSGLPGQAARRAFRRSTTQHSSPSKKPSTRLIRHSESSKAVCLR